MIAAWRFPTVAQWVAIVALPFLGDALGRWLFGPGPSLFTARVLRPWMRQ